MTRDVMQELDLQLPVVQGPMTGADSAALAAAVSAGGGLGSLGCGMRSPQA
ncbi:nitronate monooxygenase, partial [Comamonas sp.]